MDFAIRSLPFLWQGLLVTLHVSALIVFFALLAGTVMGIGIVYGPRWLYWPIRLYSDFFRGIPLLVLIFFMYYGLPIFMVNLSNFAAVVLALTAFKTAHVIEVVRGAIQSIPRGQTEAAKSIGLTFSQRLLYVIAPQAVRRFLPPWINAVVDTVKGSALVSLVGIVDLMLAIQQVIGRTYRPMPLYVLGAIMYFIINYTLSLASRKLEARFAYVRE
ncbi:MAG TPA: amino acid ABC transporter permease [Candidatus Methylomirabilis sp.]|nr:amino acid ABC transporter permease [Candidatus Methylomirabilis sp.]